jgi:WG repeat protein
VFNASVGEQDLSRPQQFGYVNRQGTMAVPASFRYADSFSEGLVAVRPSEANEIASNVREDNYICN